MSIWNLRLPSPFAESVSSGNLAKDSRHFLCQCHSRQLLVNDRMISAEGTQAKSQFLSHAKSCLANILLSLNRLFVSWNYSSFRLTFLNFASPLRPHILISLILPSRRTNNDWIPLVDFNLTDFITFLLKFRPSLVTLN